MVAGNVQGTVERGTQIIRLYMTAVITHNPTKKQTVLSEKGKKHRNGNNTKITEFHPIHLQKEQYGSQLSVKLSVHRFMK